MTKIAPCLWFDTEAEDAARFYVSVFPNSAITDVGRYPQDAGPRAGQVLTVAFTLDGAPFTALNGGPQFKFDEAVSFQIFVEDQAELDRYWEALLAGGGTESQCGWLKDRFGLSWQVVPARIVEILGGPDRAAAARVFAAIMPMVRLDIAALDAAAAG